MITYYSGEHALSHVSSRRTSWHTFSGVQQAHSLLQHAISSTFHCIPNIGKRHGACRVSMQTEGSSAVFACQPTVRTYGCPCFNRRPCFIGILLP